MRSKYSLEIVELGDRWIGVPVGEGAEKLSAMLQCNDTAAAILRLLQRDTTEAELVEVIRAEYEAPDGVIEERVHAFLERLWKEDLLV